MAELMGPDEVDAALAGLPHWRREGDEIVRDLELPDFRTAIAFVDAVADAAEAADHHPDILVHGWNKVRLSVTNHQAGGLTRADMALAATIDRLSGG
jgi:4a-hydroxytetrahydrobiopterin dehydratase